eukprot:14139696-Alexandrium_andersonii.AAC.3
MPARHWPPPLRRSLAAPEYSATAATIAGQQCCRVVGRPCGRSAARRASPHVGTRRQKGSC